MCCEILIAKENIMKKYEVHHNIQMLDRSNYKDYHNSMWVDAKSESEAVEIVINKLQNKMVFEVEERP